MNKSILLFLGGALTGVLTTLVLHTSRNWEDRLDFQSATANSSEAAAPGYDSSILDAQLGNLADIVGTLQIAASGLQQSVDTLISAASAPNIGSSVNTGVSSEPDSGFLDSQASVSQDAYLAVTPDPGTDTFGHQIQAPAVPTIEQVEIYQSIQSTLYDAMHNSSVVLSELTKQSMALTPEQRQELAAEAMGMLQRGELTTKQFMVQPDS